jgi:hypothetical protein
MALTKGSLIHIVTDRFPDANRELMARFKVVDVDEGRGLYLMQRMDIWQQPIDPPFEQEDSDESDSEES